MSPGYIAARNFQMRAQGLQAASDSLDTVSTESWRPQSACLSVWHVVVLRNKFTIRLSLQKREFQKKLVWSRLHDPAKSNDSGRTQPCQ